MSKIYVNDLEEFAVVDTGAREDIATLTTAIEGKAGKDEIPTALADLTDDSTHRVVTDDEKASWDSKSDFSGDYTDLTNKPDIPSELAELVTDAEHRTVTDTEKATWNNKSNFSGRYSDLSEKPDIPEKTSDLTNDSDYTTKAYVDGIVGNVESVLAELIGG